MSSHAAPRPTPVFRSYAAIGDSFTEGVGDRDPSRPNGLRGWADRVAEALAANSPDDFGYANFAIRGRKMQAIIDEQLQPAIDLRPDLITIYSGVNDLLRPKVDIDRICDDYDRAIERLCATGATIGVFTAFDPGAGGLFGKLRGRFAVYNEYVREIAETHGATLIDAWRIRPESHHGLWDEDRIHLAAPGHQFIAIEVLNTFDVPHNLKPLDLPPRVIPTPAERRAANLQWMASHAGPWVNRRIRGRSSGDFVEPKRPNLEPITPAEH